MKKAHEVIIFVAILAAVGIVAALLLVNRPKAEPAAPVALEKIRIANIGIYSQYNVVAKRLGIFEKHGLDAQVVEYDSGATSMNALIAGEADVAVAASFVGSRRVFTTDNLRFLGTASSHDVWRVLARKDRGVTRPADIKGKTVGVTLKTAGEFYLGKFLTVQGLTIDDVTVVDMAAPDILQAIGSGTIDAAMIFDPNAYRAEQSLGSNGVSWSAQGDRRELATIYTTAEVIAAKPAALDKYMAALVEAERYPRENPDEVKSLLIHALGYDEKYIEHIWKQFIFEIRLDQELLATMEDQAHWNVDNGFVEADRVPEYLDRVHFEPLEKADPSAVTIIHRP